MCRANAGDQDAYERLLTEIGGVMEIYLRRRFGDADLVEECVQECLLSIHRARASYDPSRPFRSWMFTIVRHKAIDLLRRRGTRQQHETAAPRGEEFAAPAVDPASSGRWFDGWKRSARVAQGGAGPPPVARPHCRLLRTGWRRNGLVDPEETPGGAD